MIGLAATIEGRDGATLRLRAETADDAPFLARLFEDRAGAMLRRTALGEAQVQQLLAIQHRAQTTSYRTHFKHASFLIVEQEGCPIGRLVQASEPGGVYVVDIALLQERQGEGLGTALIANLQAGGAGHVRARVALDNATSRRMFAKLGFVETGVADDVDIGLCWSQPPPSPS